MTIPVFQAVMLPLLRFTVDGAEHNKREAVNALAVEFKLNPSELSERLPSGQQTIFDNRVAWACTFLKKSGLLESTRRGVFSITEIGKQVLSRNPEKIDNKFLEQFPGFVEFRQISRKNKEEEKEILIAPDREQTPEEALEFAHQSIRQSLAQDLLSRILECSPRFFEDLVIELLVAMGYGGSRRDAGERVGQSGDGGIDGIIKEDRLGLDTIYIQAKRWQGSVGAPEIQKFVGALQGQRAHKGVFITTSSFTPKAIEYVSNLPTKVVLIDGQQLANLMMDFDVGVSVAASYAVKRVDSDYFEEE
ncbi:MAG: restriction endonuclease [Gallionellales bacterium RIFCSPHIGHO2_02_FULL_57_16]|nr:MAG: restriction endonuclease [Gallionellales bacterium RIFCSPHIGHO2_02_FULL_57_16]